MFTDVCEIVMLICFSIAWLVSLVKSWRSKSAKGKSILFLLLVFAAYTFGMIRKVLQYKESQAAGTALDLLFYLAWFSYGINLLLILADLVVWVRNLVYDKRGDSKARKEMQAKQETIDGLTAERDRLLQKEQEAAQAAAAEPAVLPAEFAPAEAVTAEVLPEEAVPGIPE